MPISSASGLSVSSASAAASSVMCRAMRPVCQSGRVLEIARVADVTSLRELQEGDADRVRDAFVSDAVEMSRQGDVRDLASARAYVDRMLDNADLRTLVAVDDADRLLAFAAVSVDRANANGWVFYWAHPDARRRGITSQVVRALADRELGEGGLYRLELGYRANNPGSAAVARAAGFVREGLEREKFLVDGERIDVITAARLKTDPA